MKYVILIILPLLLYSCGKKNLEKRTFITSFESVDDFTGFYITPQAHLNTTFHELNDSIVHSGTFSHKAWITGANPESTESANNNHRGYPTVQLQNTDKGSFRSPCYVTFWVWVDVPMVQNSGANEDDWLSLATFTDDESDSWKRTVLVNLSKDGFVHLQHVPKQGLQEHEFQTTTLKLPQKEWVEIKTYLDFSNGGYAKVWQNGTLVSHAKVKRTKNQLAQAHFGLYCPPHMSYGVVYNDDLTIQMVDGE